jgi:hypothetical protein
LARCLGTGLFFAFKKAESQDFDSSSADYCRRKPVMALATGSAVGGFLA